MNLTNTSVAASTSTGSGGPAAPRPPRGTAAAVVGLQWGDEGKGKVIDLLAGKFHAVVRYNGGANAGHSVVINGKRHALHLIPSGVFHPGVTGVIGNGVVLDPEVFMRELDGLAAAGVASPSLVISDRAHLVLPYHKTEDAAREAQLGAGDRSSAGSDKSIGTTRRGIGPAYADKAQRAGAIRVGDLLRPGVLAEKLARVCEQKNRVLRALDPTAALADAKAIEASLAPARERLGPMITDTTYLLHGMLAQGKSLLFEGANATLLDVDHGTFPYVTSSNCSVLGIPAGSGVPGSTLSRVIGVMKAYSTRVGGGPFPTELVNPIGDRIRERGREYGTTTGRPRRCGWLDLVALRYAVMLNGVTEVALMLLDVLAGFDELKVCTAYRVGGALTERFPPDAHDLAQAEPVFETLVGFKEEVGGARERNELPQGARRYVQFIEDALGVPVRIVSVGPDRVQTIIEA